MPKLNHLNAGIDESAKIEKLKCDILSNFQTMWIVHEKFTDMENKFPCYVQ